MKTIILQQAQYQTLPPAAEGIVLGTYYPVGAELTVSDDHADRLVAMGHAAFVPGTPGIKEAKIPPPSPELDLVPGESLPNEPFTRGSKSKKG